MPLPNLDKKPMNPKKALRVVSAVSAFTLTLVAIVAAGVRIYAFTTATGILSKDPFNRAVEAWLFNYKSWLTVHIVGALMFLLMAPFQIYSKGKGAHRLTGRIAGVAIIVSMLVAMPLSLMFNLESPLARIITFGGAALVFGFVSNGIFQAAKGRTMRHRQLLMASYILLLATSLERVWLRGLNILTTKPPDQIVNLWVPVFSMWPILLGIAVAAWPVHERVGKTKKR